MNRENFIKAWLAGGYSAVIYDVGDRVKIKVDSTGIGHELPCNCEKKYAIIKKVNAYMYDGEIYVLSNGKRVTDGCIHPFLHNTNRTGGINDVGIL